MSRRIAFAILLTVAVTLMICGALVYLSVRAVLLRDLDATLLQRAALLHKITDEAGSQLDQAHALNPADRSIVQNDRHQTLARHPVHTGGPPPQILSAQFVTMPDGTPMRTLRIQAYAQLDDSDVATPVVITYSGSAREFGTLMRSVLIAITACVVLGGAIAALLAKWLAHRALRPLRETVDSVAAIDFASLHHRFRVHLMPSELRPMADTLNKMLDRIESGATRQKRFLDDAAHELRTPIASLLLTAELELPKASAQNRLAIEPILAQARILKRLVDSLMYAARSNTEITEDPQPIELGLLIESVAQMMKPIARRHGSTITTNRQSDGIAVVPPLLLRRVLTNLVSNSIDHNPPGTEVEVLLRTDRDNAVISVIDNGQGIEPAHLDQIVRPGFRVRPDESSHDHLGVGLALVESALLQIGGTMDITSTPGKGSTFAIRIPLAIAAVD